MIGFAVFLFALGAFWLAAAVWRFLYAGEEDRRLRFVRRVHGVLLLAGAALAAVTGVALLRVR